MKLNKSKIACNKPKRTPSHPKKSHVVKACANGVEKIIRFGEQGADTVTESNPTEARAKKRASFKARHAKNIAKGKMSAAWWANEYKWILILPLWLSL